MHYFANWLNCYQMATKLSPSQYRAQAQVFKALAHPGRLLMVDELSRGERCVCELAELVGAEMPTVSRHLAQLRPSVLDDGVAALRCGLESGDLAFFDPPALDGYVVVRTHRLGEAYRELFQFKGIALT